MCALFPSSFAFSSRNIPFFRFHLFVASDRGTSRHTCAQNNVKQQHISASPQVQCVQLDIKSSRESSRISCESPWKVNFCSMYHFTNRLLSRQEPCSQILVPLIRMNLTGREHSHLKYSESITRTGLGIWFFSRVGYAVRGQKLSKETGTFFTPTEKQNECPHSQRASHGYRRSNPL